MKSPVNVVCFKWNRPGYRSEFTSAHVNRLRHMIACNTTLPFRFTCVTDAAEGLAPDIGVISLWPNPAPNYGNAQRPNCFYRLAMFDPEIEALVGKRFVWFDLDCVVTGNIDHIIGDQSDFKIWRPHNERMPCNGSLVMHRVGTRHDIWRTFRASKVHPTLGLRPRNGFTGSDQAWIAQHLGPRDKFFGKADGVYSYRCHLLKVLPTERREKGGLPADARLVFFNGKIKPWDEDAQRLEWVRDYYGAQP